MPLRRSPMRVLFCLLAFVALLLGRFPRASADVMLQGFYWDVPSPAAGNGSVSWWWDRLAAQASALRQAGFTAIWIPPVMKGRSGGYSVGYDPFDDYDIGSKDQEGTIPLRYGTREQLERCVAILRANGLNVYVDLVENHRNGDDGHFHFLYKDAYGNAQGGRFQKGPNDFHPNVPQDPDVPDETSSFGPDLAPINGGGHWVFNGLNAGGDWLTKALDLQGYRLDYVKGISTDWLRAFLDYGAMQGKFAVGEYFDYDHLDKIQSWLSGPHGMNNRCSAFDFPLRKELKAMCEGNGAYDMRQLDHAGLAGADPFHAVTWVENHDTDRDNQVIHNKALAYAYILTAEGYPCVFYRDYSTDPGCYGLKPIIDNLIFIHERMASGATQQRWKDHDVFAFERMGGSHLLVGLNENGATPHAITVDTGFGPNKTLHDYTGHGPDVHTDAAGKATLTVPADNNGSGYVCYSLPNQNAPLPAHSYAVTQEYAGAQDLDIKPADPTGPVQVCRVWAAAGQPITGALYFDTTAWTDTTRLALDLSAPDGSLITTQSYRQKTLQGTPITANATSTGRYTFTLHAVGTPSANPKPPYWLKVTYTAPQTFSL